jgi:hypothetical protein
VRPPPEPSPGESPRRGTLRRELLGLVILYVAIAVLPILIGTCSG